MLRKICFCWNRELSEKDGKLLQQGIPKSRILWLLDGYDEIVQPTQTHLQSLLDKLLRTSDHLVISRPYQNTLSYQVRMETIGITDDNIPEYISQYFNEVETG